MKVGQRPNGEEQGVTKWRHGRVLSTPSRAMTKEFAFNTGRHTSISTWIRTGAAGSTTSTLDGAVVHDDAKDVDEFQQLKRRPSGVGQREGNRDVDESGAKQSKT